MRRIILAGGLAAATVGAAVLAGAAVVQAQDNQPPRSKAEFLQQEQANLARHAAGPHATKGPPSPPPAHCQATGDYRPRLIDSPEGYHPLLNTILAATRPSAVAVSGDDIFGVSAGRAAQDSSQGEIAVQTQVLDKCAHPERGPSLKGYAVPGASGSVTLTSLNGQTVTYEDAAGHSGTFNFVTGQFS